MPNVREMQSRAHVMNKGNRPVLNNAAGFIDEDGFSYRDLLQQFHGQPKSNVKKKDQETPEKSNHPAPRREATPVEMLNNLLHFTNRSNVSRNTAPRSHAKKEEIKGDLNNDGTIDDADEKLMRDCVMQNYRKEGSSYIKAADFDDDGKITVADMSEFSLTLNQFKGSNSTISESSTTENGSITFSESTSDGVHDTTTRSKDTKYIDLKVNITVDEGNNSNKSLGSGVSNYYIRGDVNGDGKLDVLDTTALKMHMVGMKKITDGDAIRRADFDGDGKISALDLSKAIDAQIGITPIEYVGQNIPYATTVNYDLVTYEDASMTNPIGKVFKGEPVTVLGETENALKVEYGVGTHPNYKSYKIGWIPKNIQIPNSEPAQQGFIPYATTVNYDLVTYEDVSMTNPIGKVFKDESVTVLGETENALKVKYGVGTYPNYKSYKIGWIPKNIQISNSEPAQQGFRPYETTITKDLIGFSDPSFQNVSIAVHNGSKFNVINETDTALQLSDGTNTVWVTKEVKTVNAGVPIYNDYNEYMGYFNVSADFTVLQENDNAYKGIWIERKNDNGTFDYKIGWIPKFIGYDSRGNAINNKPNAYSAATKESLNIPPDEELYNFPSNMNSVGYTTTGDMNITNIHTSEVKDGMMKVDMDIYNRSSIPGVLEVLDESGNVVGQIWLTENKFMASSAYDMTQYVLQKVVDNFIDGWQHINGKMDVSYDNASESTWTKIRDLEIPIGTHIRITNSIDKSDDLKAYNVASACFDALIQGLKIADEISDLGGRDLATLSLKELVKEFARNAAPDFFLQTSSDQVKIFAAEMKKNPQKVVNALQNIDAGEIGKTFVKTIFNAAAKVATNYVGSKALETAIGQAFDAADAVNLIKTTMDVEKYRSAKPIHYYFHG